MLRVMTVLTIVFAALASPVLADVPPPYALYGIGASIADAQPFPKISTVSPGSPAARAGLKVGDGVIAINGAYSKGGAPFYFFARGLQGPQGSSVELIVLRDNREVLVVKIARSLPLR
jgi:C-terminal processing protease CtpA/Prc